jgi:hypothetical protein
MERQDLMIGDWVRNEFGDAEQVQEIGSGLVMLAYNDLYQYDDIQPILLTGEILEKNEFAYCNSNGGYYGYFEESYSNQTMEIVLFDVKSEYRNVQIHICKANYPNKIMLHLMECNYVHQLQHVLKVCGIKKEIVL